MTDQNTWQVEVDQLNHRRDLMQKMGGAERIKRHHDGGKLDLPRKSSGLTAHARQLFSRKPRGFCRQGMNAACVSYRTH